MTTRIDTEVIEWERDFGSYDAQQAIIALKEDCYGGIGEVKVGIRIMSCSGLKKADTFGKSGLLFGCC